MVAGTIVHIAGLDVEIEGRLLRQRCAWCGEILIDYVYAQLAMPGEWVKPGTFAVGALVRVEGTFPRQQVALDETRLPEDACAIRISTVPTRKGSDN